MLSVGLTGGIGAGKSAVAARLVAHGAVLVDSDRLAREVVAAGTAGLAEIVKEFGDEVLTPSGELDRPALGAVVFDDPAARARLEAITHPRIRARSAALAAAAPPDAVVVHDVPLLVEVGLAPTFHLVVVVSAAPETRVERLVRTRGMTADQARARIAAQTDDARRRAVADILLSNDRSPDDLHRAVDACWPRLREYADNLQAGRAVSPAPAVVPANPEWPAQAARLAARIRHVLPDVSVEHIGPTAVAGLAAVDDIELQIGVPAGGPVDVDALDRAGLVPRSYGLLGSADPGRPATVHVRTPGSPEWNAALAAPDGDHVVRADGDRGSPDGNADTITMPMR